MQVFIENLLYKACEETEKNINLIFSPLYSPKLTPIENKKNYIQL